jgi:hypothetical protein
MLYSPGLPNIYAPARTHPERNNTICFGTAQAMPALPAGVRPLAADQAAATVVAFWSANFNTDLATNYTMLAEADNRFVSPVAWEKNTLADPLFPVMNPHYINACTLGEAISWL